MGVESENVKMFYREKIYHDENYPDPRPLGRCIICGGPIRSEDAYYRCDDGLIHAEEQLGTVNAEEVGRVSVSCFLAYLAESCAEDEAAAAIGIERVVRS